MENGRKQVVFRFEPEDLKLLDEKAKKAGMTRQRFMSDYEV
jgi:uncharacterized protein (DUF1778 family)